MTVDPPPVLSSANNLESKCVNVGVECRRAIHRPHTFVECTVYCFEQQSDSVTHHERLITLHGNTPCLYFARLLPAELAPCNNSTFPPRNVKVIRAVENESEVDLVWVAAQRSPTSAIQLVNPPVNPNRVEKASPFHSFIHPLIHASQGFGVTTTKTRNQSINLSDRKK